MIWAVQSPIWKLWRQCSTQLFSVPTSCHVNPKDGEKSARSLPRWEHSSGKKVASVYWDHDYIRAVPALGDALTAGKHARRGPRSCLQHEVAADRAWEVLSDLTLYNEKSSSTHTALILSQKAAQEQNKTYLRVFFFKLPLSLIIGKKSGVNYPSGTKVSKSHQKVSAQLLWRIQFSALRLNL